MTISAKSVVQRISEEDCDVDIISSLPSNVIDCIMKFMPVRDAARTCVLSSKWRYVWAHHPSLVLDGDFWDDLLRRTLPNKLNIDPANIVSSILLHHVGHIRTFKIEIGDQTPIQHSNIDLWLSSLCRRGLKELDLYDLTHSKRYEVPSWVFSTSELTHLVIHSCIIKATGPIGCFSNIMSLDLIKLALDSRVLTAPLLTFLSIDECLGIRDFNISAPMLTTLYLRQNDYLNLKPFLTCSGIEDVILYNNYKHLEDCESVTLVKLLAAWPRILILAMDGICFKDLATEDVPDVLQLNLRTFNIFEIDLDSELIAWRILYILKNCPLLETFFIEFDGVYGGTEKKEEVYCNEEPSFMDCRMEQLHKVQMRGCTGSRVEVMFSKILLQCAPVLGNMFVQADAELDPCDRVMILNKFLGLQRAFPRTEIIITKPRD